MSAASAVLSGLILCQTIRPGHAPAHVAKLLARLSFAKTPHEEILVHITCYMTLCMLLIDKRP
jgi:hypothetical protein